MNKTETFMQFLKSLKGQGQDKLIESIEKGFTACYEGYQRYKNVEKQTILPLDPIKDDPFMQQLKSARGNKFTFDNLKNILRLIKNETRAVQLNKQKPENTVYRNEILQMANEIKKEASRL